MFDPNKPGLERQLRLCQRYVFFMHETKCYRNPIIIFHLPSVDDSRSFTVSEANWKKIKFSVMNLVLQQKRFRLQWHLRRIFPPFSNPNLFLTLHSWSTFAQCKATNTNSLFIHLFYCYLYCACVKGTSQMCWWNNHNASWRWLLWIYKHKAFVFSQR